MRKGQCAQDRGSSEVVRRACKEQGRRRELRAFQSGEAGEGSDQEYKNPSQRGQKGHSGLEGEQTGA